MFADRPTHFSHKTTYIYNLMGGQTGSMTLQADGWTATGMGRMGANNQIVLFVYWVVL